MQNYPGLTKAQVKQKKNLNQVNILPQKTTKTYQEIIQKNVFNFINNVLYFIGFVLILLGRWGDAVVSLFVVLINVLVGLVQEIRAKQKLDKIALLTRPKVKIFRDGGLLETDPDEIVLGDFILVESGDEIVVDGKILEGEKVEFDESQLTGESNIVKKSLGDEVLSGSFCLSGQAIFKVKKVGEDCLVNQMSAGAMGERKVLTPLQKQTNAVVRVLILVASYLFALIFLSNVIQNRPVNDLVGNMGVIVGLVPNSLFLMITLSYSMGALRLAGKGVLVQELNAVESLSNIDILCLDKTGTITTGELKLENVITDPKLKTADIKNILANFVTSQTQTNATADALLENNSGKKQEVIQEIPFSSSYKWSGLNWKNLNKKDQKFNGLVVLGALEILSKGLVIPETVQNEIDKYLQKGFRILLFTRSDQTKNFKFDKNQNPILPKNLELLAAVIIKDEIRPNLKHTLNKFRQTGIEFKVISGDNPKTVLALSQQIHLAENYHLISGLELEEMDKSEFKNAVLQNNIFGRITPIQKAKIIEVLKQNQKYVAMVGDGVNDLLSLKKADLGLSMETGSQATRSLADIVLLKDNFGALPLAFLEGQRIRNGMESVSNLYLTRVLFTVLLIVSIGLAGSGFPFTIRQNSFLALITVGIPAFFLTLSVSPGRENRKTLVRSLTDFVIPAGFVLSVFALILYLSYLLISAFLVDQTLLTGENAIEKYLLSITYTERVRAILTSFVTFSGLSLILFIAPPNDFWKVGVESVKSKRPSFVVFILAILALFLLFSKDYVKLFQLEIPELWEVVLIVIFYLTWLFVMRFSWKTKIFDKILSWK